MVNGTLLQTNVRFLKIWAIYPPKRDANFCMKFADGLYKFISVITLYCILIPCTYEWYLGEKSKITDYTLNIMNTGAYLCSILTLHFFHTRGKIARDLVEEMNYRFKYKADSQVTESTMEKMDKLTRKITIGFCSLLNSGVILMAIVPMVMPGRVLPIPGRYPFKSTETPYYQLMYAWQFYAQLIIGSVTSSADAFFISVVLLAAKQFRVLASDFHDCLYTVLLDSNVPKKSVLNFKDSLNLAEELNYLRSPEAFSQNFAKLSSAVADNATAQINLMELIGSKAFERKLRDSLIGNIEHHQMLLNFCAKVENFFWPLIFMKVAVSMFYHIFITFAMISSTDPSMAFTLAQYELCAVTELFIFALAGQALINESENFRQELYNSPWYFCNQQYKKAVYMILMRCNRPTRVTVGKLTDMSLPTFIVVSIPDYTDKLKSIMKTALSYFAVLRQVTTE